MSAIGFGISDIESFKVRVVFDKIELETLHNKLKSIERGRFISGKILSDNFFQYVEENIPSLQLTGDGFQIQVHPASIPLIVTSKPTKDMFKMLPLLYIWPPKTTICQRKYSKTKC